MAKQPKLGSGRRFAAGVNKMTAKGMSSQEASAIMAKAGDKKYGVSKMNKMAQAGKKRAKK